MKNYFNYYPSSKVVKKNNVDTWFYNMVNQSEDGCEPIINEIKVPCLIQQHTNPMDEYKEDRKLIALSNTIKKGDIIENYENATWLIVTDVDLDCYYYTCKIRKCNYTLKWKDKFNKIHKMPCYTENATFYSLGVKFEEISTPDLKLKITMPWNEDSKDLYLGQRFLFHKSAYIITSLDYTQTYEQDCYGILSILMTQKGTSIHPKDDLENDLAYNGSFDYNLSIKENDLILSKDDILQLNPLLYIDGQLQNNNNYQFEWISSNEKIAYVDDNGLLTCVDNGVADITVMLKSNNNITNSIVCEVTSAPTDNEEIKLEGDEVLMWTTNQIFKASKIINGVEDTSIKFNFKIDYQESDTNVALLEVIDDTSCKITANDKRIRGNIVLIATDVESKKEIKKDIEIVGFFG
ncbi:hypothetical protein K144316041_p20270 (plasmid) [Clostridium tetani]|uniref:Ig-like domain-containing protein n=1 Tax=Clostridium tetani TaxID=1513 RepID=UPI002954B2EE|nr:Ig-like domain-containing protein [Clostridium tetani]BDR74188.1 hypothetical protein K144316041_p20270 [Clostridium tetani]